jgi:amino acid transporter
MTKPEIMQSKITLAVAYIGKIYDTPVTKASEWVEPACGVCNSSPHKAQIAISGFIALGAFGNIVIVTYIASRVKQEIAKEGILPFSSLFARDYKSPIFYFLRLLPRYRNDPEALERKLERTPAGGIFLHWLFSVILVVSPPNPQDGYQLLVYLHSYVMAWFGFILAIGMIYLYRRKADEWIHLCRRRWVPWGGSGLPYAIFMAIGLLPVLILGWFPRKNGTEDDTNEFNLSTQQCSRYAPGGLHWALSPGLGMGLFAGGVIYWMIFVWVVPRITKLNIKTVRIAVINTNEESEPYMVKEFIFIRWVFTLVFPSVY